MVSAGFTPAGPQLAATQMATERSLLSVRFIRNGVELSGVSHLVAESVKDFVEALETLDELRYLPSSRNS